MGLEALSRPGFVLPASILEIFGGQINALEALNLTFR